MRKGPPTLGIELRFLPNARVVDWEAALAAFWSWDPDLHPAIFQVTIGEGRSQPGERPWDETRAPELARLCTGRAEFAWMLGGEPGHHMSCEGHDGRISIGIQIPAPRQPPVDLYLHLLHELPGTNLPALGMLFHYEDIDASFDRQGLRRLSSVPPILHLGVGAVEQIGGHEKLRQVPCEVRDTPGGGLLFVVRANPFARPTKDEKARTHAVAEFLGIGEEKPLVLPENS